MSVDKDGATLFLQMTYLAWPAAVVIIALVAISIFKKPLERLIDRTKKITTSGLETSAAAQEVSLERKESAAEELLARFDNALIREQEDLIRQELNNRRVDQPAERERVLVRHLAAAFIYGQFERTYHAIFGSQIKFLQAMNAAPGNKNSAELYYLEAFIASPDFYEGYSLDQWLQFLYSKHLLVINGDAISITVFGRQFLMFIVQEGYATEKSG